MNNLSKILSKILENCNSHIPFTGSFRFDEAMAHHTTYKTGGPADLWIKPQGECFPEYAAVLLKSARSEGVPVFILGGGANLAVPDEGIRGIVLDTTAYTGCHAEVPPGKLRLKAGTALDDAAEIAAGQGLSGLEFLAGMPGSLGGALYMNARAYDREMADVIDEVQILNDDGISTITPQKTDFSYKKSPFQGKSGLIKSDLIKSELIIDISVILKEGDPEIIRETMSFYRKDREAKGHYRYPSAGSVFKNNRAFGKATGQIIDELGLKGFAVGDAQVAPWHGNFIINRGKARTADILALVEMLENRVRAELGIELEREIIFVKNA